MRNINLIKRFNWKVGVRNASSLAEVSPETVPKNRNRMSGWQIHNYSESVSELQNAENLKKPHIKTPSQLLVKVLASSVNPIDVAMMSKYGFFYFDDKLLFSSYRRLWINCTEYNAMQ
jgi:hypothetical protein